MARFIKKTKQEIGISPRAFLFRGNQKIDNVILSIIDYDADNIEEKCIDKVSEVLKYQEKNTVTWLNVDGLHNANVLEEIAKNLNLDELILAKVMDVNARPNVQEQDNCIFISIKMLQPNEETNLFTVENLSIIITPQILISFQEKKGDIFNPIRERLKKPKKKLRTSGTDYLAFAMLDIVIDNYIYILGVLGEKIEILEEKLLHETKKGFIDEINIFKRELNYLRKNILPAKELLLSLSKIESDFIDESNDIHFKELVDNINHAIESSESYREILSDQLIVYHTTISSKLNDIMKFLTIFSVIFIPLTFIVGIYGTNFDVLPELHYQYSYFVMWGVMLIMAVGMLFYFKKKRWF